MSAKVYNEATAAALVRKAETLLIFHGLWQDKTFKEFISLVETAGRALTEEKPSSLETVYRRVFSALAEKSELATVPLVGDSWQNHLLELMLADENVLSLKAARGGGASPGPSLLQAAAQDLEVLEELFFAGAEILAGMSIGRENLPSWEGFSPLLESVNYVEAEMLEVKKAFLLSKNWPSLLETLLAYYRCFGGGAKARFLAFRWMGEAGDFLKGISRPDPVRLEELVGCEKEHALIIENTEQFLGGFPAHNMLLYGDRGTGKSSTVKALLNRYDVRGLRLVEVGKGDLGDMASILEKLGGSPLKYIIFIDDLSFEEEETVYKELKAVLEGSLEIKPANVLIYATSNRRHLVREYLNGREEGFSGREARYSDTVQEKLSLAERFGITVIFTTPGQKQYLALIDAMAGRRGIVLEPGELHSRALKWALWQNSPSGRTARQFVDYLWGILEAEKKAAAGGEETPPVNFRRDNNQ